MIASYLTYFVIKPEGRTNYGSLLDPRTYPMPALGTTTLDGKAVVLDDYKGKWIMLQVNDGDCQEPCQTKLYEMRQLRLTQGKDKDRIERVWLVTDNQPVETRLIREYDGTHILRANPNALKAWLPVDNGTTPADHIYMIDPLGNLMMRFPKDADPNKIKKDLNKLMKASRIG
ncbi:cytochrome C oxidase subunit I [Noviherbaspirillum cavernae]|uniref:Cytochrome C oxidase subunit I n=2 Tax=Noviherbaspirillum cavernae TaxID=2320862 RepID=A0A418X5S6_9BURK|nr:cytochrome C oxidase subunit I [Noviherbaspirillum cavernae]